MQEPGQSGRGSGGNDTVVGGLGVGLGLGLGVWNVVSDNKIYYISRFECWRNFELSTTILENKINIFQNRLAPRNAFKHFMSISKNKNITSNSSK